MDLDQAVQAHSQWKKKLADYLAKRDGSLIPAELSMDNKCPLGQWIYGEGAAKFSQLPEFPTLKREHTRFHKAVGDVVRNADSGKSITEEIALGSKSEFGAASSAVVTAILNLKARVPK